jgi:hypothetical protein
MPGLPRVTLFVSMLVSIFALQGCLSGHHHRSYSYSHHQGHHRSSDAELIGSAIGLVAGIAILAASGEHRPRREEPAVVQQVVYVNGAPPAPLPASPRDRVIDDEDEMPGFDAKRARVALGSVDLSECRVVGAPRGYGHARVTFNPDGGASKVVVDTPSGLGDLAVKCIGDRLGAVTVPQYKGSLVNVGTIWFIP